MLTTGMCLGPYEILASLGAGGMGEVYRARDTRLKREVAVKVLPTTFATDPERLRRFEQEAEAAGALNHPNVLAVYDVGTHDGAPYIVSELLEGETLRDRLAGGAFTPRRAIGNALQIVQGLAAAHEKGIVHRDLKPENVFVTSDGRVKILDFGLAKLTQSEAPLPGQTNLPTAAAGTEPGVVLGTLGYMSPEQVRGRPSDARSDIFAFGAILYEMLSGRRAFHGDTAADTISAILTRDPPDLSETNRRIPESLDRIVDHCLEKAPEARFQSARDIAFDLEAISGSSLVSAAGAAPGVVPWSVRGKRALPWLALPVALVAYLAGRQTAPKKIGAPRAALGEVQKLTIQPGVESFPSLSPDATTVVYQAGPPGNSDLFLQRVGGHNPINLTKDCEKDDTLPAFSPSGAQIAFRSECGGGGIFLMGATGENVRRLTDFGFHPAWSPDEKEIAVSTEGNDNPYVRFGVSSLWAIDVATGQKRPIVQTFDCEQPSWSPHGDRIACWGLRGNSGQRDIWTVRARGEADAKGVEVTNDPPTDWNPFWSPDGRFLYFASDRGGSMNLWRVAIDEKTGRTLGQPDPVTLPASWSGPLSASRDGKHIVFEARTSLPSIQRVPFDSVAGRVAGEADTVFRGSIPILTLDISPNGQWIAFSSGGGRQDLFLIRSDGTGMRQLTDDPAKDRGLAWSRDGQRIYFMSDRSGRYDLWAIRADGSGLVPVTKDAGEGPWWPVFSPDGSVFAFPDGTNAYLFRPGGAPGEGKLERLPSPAPDHWFEVRDWSSDGKVLAGSDRLVGGAGGEGILLYSLDSRKYERLTDSGDNPRFLPDGRRLIFMDHSALRLVDSVSKKTREILPPRSVSRFGFVLSRDGRSVYVRRDLQESDIWEATLK